MSTPNSAVYVVSGASSARNVQANLVDLPVVPHASKATNDHPGQGGDRDSNRNNLSPNVIHYADNRYYFFTTPACRIR